MSRMFVIGMITRPSGVSLKRYPIPTVNQKGLRWHNWNHLAGLDHLDPRCKKRNRFARCRRGAMFGIRFVNGWLIHVAYDTGNSHASTRRARALEVHLNPLRSRQVSTSSSSEEITKGCARMRRLHKNSGTNCRIKSRCESR